MCWAHAECVTPHTQKWFTAGPSPLTSGASPASPCLSPPSSCYDLLPWACGPGQVDSGGTMSDEVSQAIWELGMATVGPTLSCQHHSTQGRGQVARSPCVHMPGSSQDMQVAIYLGAPGLWRVEVPGLTFQPLPRALPTGLAFGRRGDTVTLWAVLPASASVFTSP